MSQPGLSFRIVNLSLSIFPLYLRIVKGPSRIYGYTFGWGCYPLYLQHKKFTLVSIPNFHWRGIDYIYKKRFVGKQWLNKISRIVSIYFI